MKALLIALCLLLVAAPLAWAKAPAACDILTQADAQGVLGQNVKSAMSRGPNAIGQSICFYEVTKGTAVRYVQLSLTLPPPAMRKNMNAAQLFAQTKASVQGAQSVPGVGDKAFWGGSGLKAGAGLHVLKGDYYLTVDVASGDPARNLDQAKKLAAELIKRLK
ncbi:MAG: hypothetical protein AB1814_10390 [Thermodesulfobacteriota bacterium]